MAVKVLRLRRADTCVACSADLAIGTEASWDGTAKTVTCMACAASIETTTLDPGVAGRSAARQYEQTSKRERARKEAVVAQDAQWRTATKEKHPVIGRVVTGLTPKPVIGPESQATAAWKKGAEGERRVGDVLESISGVRILHDRRIPGSRANIDHLAVGPTGVYVVDPKKYDGAVEKRDLGGWLRTDLRLYVAGRDRTKLVRGVEWQIEIVESALTAAGLVAPVRGLLCFVESTWPIFKRPLGFDRVTALWPAALPERIGAAGPLSGEEIDRLATCLAATLRPA